jgi:hypothetical protein
MSSKKDKKELTSGLVVTVFEDEGPTNIFNSSPLGENEAFNMAIKTLTMIGTTSVFDKHEIRIYGPIPTPKEPFNTIAFMFMLKAKESMDERIARAGRLIIFWIITNSPSLTKYTDLIKLMIQRTLRIYEINQDADLYREGILEKINDQLQIVDTGKDYYYITEEDNIEAFVSLSMIPESVPVMIVNSETKQIQVLFRDRKTTAIMKTKIRSAVNVFKDKLPKGSLFRVEMISDPISVNQILTSSGLEIEQAFGTRYRIRLTDKIEFSELDDFFSLPFKKIQSQLTKLIVSAFNEKRSINLEELSNQTGLTINFLTDIITRALEANILVNAKIEDDSIKFL